MPFDTAGGELRREKSASGEDLQISRRNYDGSDLCDAGAGRRMGLLLLCDTCASVCNYTLLSQAKISQRWEHRDDRYLRHPCLEVLMQFSTTVTVAPLAV